MTLKWGGRGERGREDNLEFGQNLELGVEPCLSRLAYIFPLSWKIRMKFLLLRYLFFLFSQNFQFLETAKFSSREMFRIYPTAIFKFREIYFFPLRETAKTAKFYAAKFQHSNKRHTGLLLEVRRSLEGGAYQRAALFSNFSFPSF